MQPFAEFKAQVNEIIGIIDRPVQIIDSQVKAFENAEKDKKKSEIENIWGAENHPEWMRLDQIWNDRWLNKTYQLEAIKTDMQNATAKAEKEIQVINGLPEFSFEAMMTYKETLDVTRAVATAQKLANVKKAKEEAETRKAEEARRAEEAKPAPQPEPTPEPTPTPELQKAVEPEASWIRFQARLTVPQALALKAFFETNGIEYKPIG
jgi:hypothetical protein